MKLFRHMSLAARWTLYGVRQSRKDVLTALLASIAIGTVLSLLSLNLAWTIEALLSGERVLWRTAGSFAVLGISYFLFITAREHALHRATLALGAVQQSGLFEQLLQLPLSAYQVHRNADAYFVAAIVLGFTRRFTLSVLALILGIGEIVPLAILLCLRNAFGVVLALIALCLLIVVFSGVTIAIQRHVSTKTDALFHFTRQILQGVAKLRVLSAVESIFGQWRARRQYQDMLFRSVAMYDQAKNLILLVYIFACLTAWSDQNPGLVFAAWLFLICLTNLIDPILQLVNSMSTQNEFFPLLEQVSPHKKALAPRLTGRIHVENVTFSYAGAQTPLLDNVSFQIKSGQHVAILGASGMGKSTLMSLMVGIAEPQSGTIRYDDIDLQTLDLSSVRRQIGIVTQKSAIAIGSVWANIAGFTQMSIDDAWRAASLAQINTVIDDLPMGMHTLLDQNASVLSRGQGQRLLLAQALAHQPGILFLDEAMNAIDDDTQHMIFQTLKPFTLIVIAQRLSTMRFMDVIYVLSNGTIVESGSYDELMAQKGEFVRLIEHQLI